MATALRLGSLLLGLICAALGACGAFEFARKLEGGGVTYIVLAAPVIAGVAVLVPPLAEQTLREGLHVEAIAWWLVLAPAAATVFSSAAERVRAKKKRRVITKCKPRAPKDGPAVPAAVRCVLFEQAPSRNVKRQTAACVITVATQSVEVSGGEQQADPHKAAIGPTECPDCLCSPGAL